MAAFSKSRIDRLGDRLRRGPPSEADLRLLDEYRRSFGSVYESVIRTIREGLQLDPTGRPAKSTTSIAEKLRRESIRLSQLQDIAGCRVVVSDIVVQDQTITMLRDAFPEAKVIDRRTNPNYGYRAVHVIVNSKGVNVEVQVRSALQHLWAELSEKFSDLFDPALKYGGGPTQLQNELMTASNIVVQCEELKKKIAQLQNLMETNEEVESLQKEMLEYEKNLIDAFTVSISNLSRIEKT
jgi:ppGpp synthetase/RelA/SpoT-type nucleotidyltranferase